MDTKEFIKQLTDEIEQKEEYWPLSEQDIMTRVYNHFIRNKNPIDLTLKQYFELLSKVKN